MSTITREHIANLIEFNSEGSDCQANAEQWEVHELARIALASLEAKPVAYSRDGFRADGVHFCGGIITAEEHERTKPVLSDRYTWKHHPLYTAPPAPVSVPDELSREEYKRRFMEEDNFDDTFRGGWNACRAAMLQNGNSPAQSDCCPAQKCISPAQDGNSPAIPDGWVACSERMPEAIGEYLVAYKWMNRWIYQKVITFAHLSEYTNEMGWNSDLEITHWMPLPAAPQQE